MFDVLKSNSLLSKCAKIHKDFDIFSEHAYLNGEIRNLKAMFDTCQTQVSTVIIHKHGSSVGGGQGIPQERVYEGGLSNHPIPQHHTAKNLSLA